MIQLCRDADLAKEPVGAEGVGDVRQNCLDCDCAIMPGVDRAIHLGVSAAADLLVEAVRPCNHSPNRIRDLAVSVSGSREMKLPNENPACLANLNRERRGERESSLEAHVLSIRGGGTSGSYLGSAFQQTRSPDRSIAMPH